MAITPQDETREQCVCMAMNAEAAGRFEDTVKIMEKIVVKWTPPAVLTDGEMNLLESAYKKAIGNLQTCCQNISAIEERNDNKIRLENARIYRSELEAKIRELCCGILNLLDHKLLPFAASNHEAEVFYLKMKGMCNGHLVELSSDAGMEAYIDAQDISRKNLAPIHPLRLKTSLEFAIFSGQAQNLINDACRILNQAMEDAKPYMNNLDEKAFEESKDHMKKMLEYKMFLNTMQEEMAAELKDVAPKKRKALSRAGCSSS